jgi:transcriptional regulator with XRE-family HTH domain
MRYLNMTNLRDKEILKNFGSHLKKLREKKNITQAQLASDMNVEISQISRIERGIINPSLCTVVEIAKAIGISPSKLLETDF